MTETDVPLLQLR